MTTTPQPEQSAMFDQEWAQLIHQAEEENDVAGDGGAASPLERDVGSEVYHRLHTTFLDQLGVQLAGLMSAADVGDVAGARYVAHQIKGTAPSFGATRLDELADHLLELNRDQDQVLRSLVEQIAGEVRKLRVVPSA